MIPISRRCFAGAGRGSQMGVTGKLRPSEVTTGASLINFEIGSASNVADITTIRRSSRRASRISKLRASPRSAFNERSWNSSKMMQDIPRSSGSDWIIRVRMPSVTTSIFVVLLVFVFPRTRYPIVCPTISDSVVAMRSAAARAAKRRGSSMMIFPSKPPSANRAKGTTVVFPAPGGAHKTTRCSACTARISSCRTS